MASKGDRELSLNSITIYIDTEKRHSVAISSGTLYRTVERLLKKVNANPQRYQYQNCVIIHIYWTLYIWYIVLIIFIIISLLILFFAFFPDDIFKIWLRQFWFYLCISINLFIILSVIIYYIIQKCDKNRWLNNELNRIHVLIKQSNTIEYSDKHNYKKKSKKNNWIDYYTDSETEYDQNNINNLHFVNLIPKPLSKKDKKEDVIKMDIEIWLENKPKKLQKQISKIDETHDIDNGETDKLINYNNHNQSDIDIDIDNIHHINNKKIINDDDVDIMIEMKDEEEIQHILPTNHSDSD